METLPDYLDDNLNIIAVGLNPSPSSVRQAYPYANPRNRFWSALNRSRLVGAHYEPSVLAMHQLLGIEKIGFTDIVKRPSSGAADLRAEDYRIWAPVLMEKLERYAPKLVWFQGKGAYENYLRHGLKQKQAEITWGLQVSPESHPPIFVTPNPSAANAAFSLDTLVRWMDCCADTVASMS